MFDIQYDDEGIIVCAGRLDAAQCETGQTFMDEISESSTLDFSQLEYISSAGLGILLKHKNDWPAAAARSKSLTSTITYLTCSAIRALTRYST